MAFALAKAIFHTDVIFVGKKMVEKSETTTPAITPDGAKTPDVVKTQEET